MLQCCSHPGDSCLPAASPCQRCAGASPPSAASFPEVDFLPGGQRSSPTHGRQPAGSASPPRARGSLDSALGSLGGPRALPAAGIIVPIPPPAPVPADSRLAGSVPCVPRQEEGQAAPKSALMLSPPHCEGLHSHIPCLIDKGSPPRGTRPDAKTRSTSPDDSSCCRAHQQQYLTQGRTEDGIQCAVRGG